MIQKCVGCLLCRSGEAIQMPASAEQALQEELERIEKLYGLTDEKIEMEPVIEFEGLWPYLFMFLLVLDQYN